MKLLAMLCGPNEIRMKWAPDNWNGEGWCKIEREPDFAAGEYLSFDEDLKTIVILKREKSADGLASEAAAAVRAEIAQKYSTSDELKLMNAAIEALARGYKLPQEYLDYRAAVAAAKEKAP